jgi:hypothetical protein
MNEWEEYERNVEAPNHLLEAMNAVVIMYKDKGITLTDFEFDCGPTLRHFDDEEYFMVANFHQDELSRALGAVGEVKARRTKDVEKETANIAFGFFLGCSFSIIGGTIFWMVAIM